MSAQSYQTLHLYYDAQKTAVSDSTFKNFVTLNYYNAQVNKEIYISAIMHTCTKRFGTLFIYL